MTIPCLAILSQQTESSGLREVINQVAKDVEAGQSLSDSMAKHPKVFPPIFINMVRAGTVGTNPRFIQMIRELVEERLSDNPTRLALGKLGPNHDVCPDDCCLYVPKRN